MTLEDVKRRPLNVGGSGKYGSRPETQTHNKEASSEALRVRFWTAEIVDEQPESPRPSRAVAKERARGQIDQAGAAGTSCTQ